MISIIIPTFNRCDFIHSAIESAINQSEIVEIIVVDDGSSDNTENVVKSIDYPIKYFYQNNKGVSAARNLGIREASGDYLIFLDSDDIITPDKIDIQAKILNSNSDVSIVYSRWRTTLIDGTELREVGIDHTPNVLPTLLCKNIVVIHSCLFRSDAIRQIGGFDEDLIQLEDWDLLLRLALNEYKFSFTSDITAIYRLHSNNISYSRQETLNNALKLTNKLFDNGSIPRKYKGLYNIFGCLRYLETVRRCFVQSEYENAYTYIKQMFESMPFTIDWILVSSIDQILTPVSGTSSIKPVDYELVKKIKPSDVGKLRDILENYVKSL